MVRFFLFYVARTATIIIHLVVKTSANVSGEFRKQLYDDSLLGYGGLVLVHSL